MRSIEQIELLELPTTLRAYGPYLTTDYSHANIATRTAKLKAQLWWSVIATLVS